MPWTLWVYVAYTLATSALVENRTAGPLVPKVGFAIVILGWLFFLVKGLRWLWFVTLAVGILGFVADLITGPVRWKESARCSSRSSSCSL